jgi:hypothetical protein
MAKLFHANVSTFDRAGLQIAKTKNDLMELPTRKIMLSLAIFAIMALVIVFLGAMQNGGVVGIGWAFYYLEWIACSWVGLFVFVLRKVNLFKGRASFFYIFLGVANLCNAICGALLLWVVTGQNDAASTWLELGATGVIGFLILVDGSF